MYPLCPVTNTFFILSIFYPVCLIVIPKFIEVVETPVGIDTFPKSIALVDHDLTFAAEMFKRAELKTTDLIQWQMRKYFLIKSHESAIDVTRG